MHAHFRWTGAVGFALVVGLAACSGGDGDPTDPDPDPTGSVRVTVTGEGSALAGVTVRLYADGGAAALHSGATAANGQVTFADLAVGAYDVDIMLPAGYELSAGGTLRRDVSVTGSQVASVTFALAEIVVPPTVGQIRARATDAGTGVADLDVNLYASGGSTVLQTVATGSDGRALFIDLDPGTYDVEVVLPAGYAMAGSDTARKAATVTAGTITDVEFSVDAPTVVTVQAEGTAFAPATVTIAVGTVVRWQRINLVHTVTPVGHTEWTEATIDGSNPTFEHLFDQAGQYDYRCTIHAGMNGTVTVQ